MTARITNNFGTSAISRDVFSTLPTLKDCGQIKHQVNIFLNQICGPLFLTLEIRVRIKKELTYFYTDSVQLVLY